MLDPTPPTSPTNPSAPSCSPESSAAMDSPPTTPSSTSSGPFSHSHRDSISTISTIFSAPPSEEDEQQNLNTKAPSTTEANLPPSVFALLSSSTTTVSAIETVKLDPLSRTFPKPTCTATIDEMLARTPGKWSLNHYVKHGKEVRAPTVDKELRARQFAETKAQLLRAQKEMDLGGRR